MKSRIHTRTALSHEPMEFRLCLSAVAFAPHNIVASEVDDAQSVVSADLDRDGDADIIFASSADNKVAWFENVDGRGTFSSQRLITIEAIGANSVTTADVDGDGDIDVLSASAGNNTVAWYENSDGDGNFGASRIIADDVLGVATLFAADMDGDGDVDVLTSSERDDVVVWYENVDGAGNFSPQTVSSFQAFQPGSVVAADLDGDQDLDVVSAGNLFNLVHWYENIDGGSRFGVQQLVGGEPGQGTQRVFAADLDGDDDVDILTAFTDLSSNVPRGRVSWYENTDGRGNFAPPRAITTETAHAESVFTADLDGDGDLDVLSASSADQKVAWYENLDGAGNFGVQQIVTTSAPRAKSVFAADIDNDGDADILSAGDTIVAWYENTDGQGGFGPQQSMPGVSTRIRSAIIADLDNDGDSDILTSLVGGGEIGWFENADGQGRFVSRPAIDGDHNAASLFAGDIDGDGDTDILSASTHNGTVVWFENLGDASSFQPRTISVDSDGVDSVLAADFDGDGDLDVLSNSPFGWFENVDGKGEFGPRQDLRGSDNGLLFAADMDQDNDVDFLKAFGSNVVLYENLDGRGTFERIFVDRRANFISSVFAADIDNDQDNDIVWSSFADGKIAWYENTDGRGTFDPFFHVISEELIGGESVFAIDVDEDGDTDVLSASSFDNKVAWYENVDGTGNFGPQRLISINAEGAFSVLAADFDNDGDVDVLAQSTGDANLVWYENRLPGDVNDDGTFNSADLVAIFQVGEYEDGIVNNSSFEDGDWNGDGEFDTSDLVFAFQLGIYT